LESGVKEGRRRWCSGRKGKVVFGKRKVLLEKRKMEVFERCVERKVVMFESSRRHDLEP